ncbi:MAG: hypothetical protein RLZZ528_232 [Pseudomonadota bacterium]
MFSYPTPFTPPTTEDDRLSWLRLIRSRRVGPATFLRLLSDHGTAAAALAALPAIARASGIDDYEPCPEPVAQTELKAGQRLGARLVFLGAPDYPAPLARIADAPPLFWALGDGNLFSRPVIGMVGARNASSLGLRMARRLAEGLGEAGFVIASGLARGIDAAAHRAALPFGTIAVQAGGLDVIYPSENAELARDIARQGLRLSEQPIGLDPQARHFPQRNRIISGLSQAIVVVEAALQSGSLITARTALDQGREVMAVPGHPFDGRAGGCNALIRDGAVLVRGPEDVLAHLAPRDTPRPAAAPPPAATAPAPSARVALPEAAGQARILDLLGPSPLAEDQLIRDLALPASDVAPLLLSLELDGRIQRQPGGLIARV